MGFIVLVQDKPVYKVKYPSVGTAVSVWMNFCSKHGATEVHNSCKAYSGHSRVNKATGVIVELRIDRSKSIRKKKNKKE